MTLSALPRTLDRRHSKDRQVLHRTATWAGAIVAAIVAVWPQFGAFAAEPARPPNIVLIMADDMGYECLGANGSMSYRTPRLDRLASEGMRFEHCYSQPLCTPSRVQIMTGRYNHRNYRAFGYLDPRETTFAQVLKQAGYATCIVGKWQLNGISGTYWPGHDDNTRPHQAGFDEYSLWQVTQERSKGERYADPLIEQNGTLLGKQKDKYGPDIFCDYAIDFVSRHREQPFLLYWPMVLPHDPFVPTPDSPEWADASQRYRQDNKFFADMVAYLDKVVGRLVDAVDEMGLRENTIILFTSDNGTSTRITSQTQNGNVRGGKGTTPNAGTHVPLIVSWKGRTPAGRVSRELIDFSDFLPTLAEAAGAKLPAVEIDGRSFLPQLRGETGRPRDWIFCHYDPQWGRLSQYRTRFARDQRFKLYRDGRLFDVPADTLEQRPLAADERGSEAAAARRKLQSVLSSMQPWAPAGPMPPGSQ